MFSSEPFYNDKYIKTKIKIYNNRINANFQGSKISENNQYCTCLSVILLDSVIKIDYDYYSQIPLGECKYPVKLKNAINEELNLDESDHETNNDKFKSDED